MMEAAAPGQTSATTAVRIVSISAAQNKRGKDCYEGGMSSGHFTWYKDMGGNSNWMYLAVTNATTGPVSLALWLLYEAATEPLVDPLCTSGDIQVGFFNQSKNMNRQVPLFELAEESKPMLEMASGEAATLKVRINDLSSHHQNQRFILVAGPADAPIRGSRSVPIEIMSKPRLEDAKKSEEKKPRKRGAVTADQPSPKRAALNVSGERAVDLARCSFCGDGPSSYSGAADGPHADVTRRASGTGEEHRRRAFITVARQARQDGHLRLFSGGPAIGCGADVTKRAPALKFKSLAKAIVELKRNELGHKRSREAGMLSEDELRSFFVDEGGDSLFESLSPRAGDAPGA